MSSALREIRQRGRTASGKFWKYILLIAPASACGSFRTITPRAAARWPKM
jgi:hypothetical protein